ncbi:MAG TPA: hypothetical protein VFK43_19705 [Acidimicrobiales bacterium]|nr:hypothetical protein [Acidimicrobiales bacterium]
METQRWINQRHPQTLLFATYLLYFDAFFGILAILGGAGPIAIALAVGSGAAGYGIANGKKWGYGLALAVAVLRLVDLVAGHSVDYVIRRNTIELMFSVALLALVLHPQSREYQKIWFS